MPQGIGTYGTQVGRPRKYQRGGIAGGRMGGNIGGMAGGMRGNRNISPIAQSLVNPFQYGFQPGESQGRRQFQGGGEVGVPTAHENMDALIQANTLEQVANFPRGESLDILFKALTQGGDTRYMGGNIPGLPTQGRTDAIANNLQRILNENPAYADTMSTEMAKQFMPEGFPGEERNEQSMMERLMGLFGK